jgi:hypothetical protein
MQFHAQVFGANVRLADDRTSAWRRSPERSFCDSLVFSDRPLRFSHPLRIRLHSNSDHGWKGVASIGLTCHEPSTFSVNSDDGSTESALPSLAVPIGLCEQSGVWLRPLPVACLNRVLHIILQPHPTGTELTAVLTSDQQFWLLSSLPVQDPLWLVIDLFGQTHRVDLLAPICTESLCRQFLSRHSASTEKSLNADESIDTNDPELAEDSPLQCAPEVSSLQVNHVPGSVLSGGPKAVEAYANECKDGAVPYNCVRLFLIGASGAGKSTLRQQLTRYECNVTSV